MNFPAPGLDRYLQLKERKTPQIFVFLLGEEEHTWLDEETCWVHRLRVPCHVVRLTEDEFRILDIGVHPKTVITKGGNDVLSFSGVPHVNTLTKCLHSL